MTKRGQLLSTQVPVQPASEDSQPASHTRPLLRPNIRIRANISNLLELKGCILVQGADSLPEEVWLHILSRVTEGNYGRTEASITSKSWRHLCRRTYRSMHINTRKGTSWRGFCTWLELYGDQLTQLQFSKEERQQERELHWRYDLEHYLESTNPVWFALKAHGSHLQLQQLLVPLNLATTEAALMYEACMQAPALRHLSLLPTSSCLQGLSSLTQLQSLQLGAGGYANSHAYVITAADLTLLTRLKRLTTLQLEHCSFTSPLGSPDLGLLTTVQHLVLENVSIRSQQDVGWSAANLTPALAKHLSANFARLVGLKSFRVKVGSTGITSAFLVAAPSLTALQQLELLAASQDSDLQSLSTLSHLCSISRLSVAGTSRQQVQAAALFSEKPTFCSALVSLDVDDCQLTSINTLSDLHCLTYLSANSIPLTTFAALSSFQQLRHLSLRKTLEARVAPEIASEAWLAVAELGKLSWLEFTARKRLYPWGGGGYLGDKPANRVFHWDFTPSITEKRLTVAAGTGQSHFGGFGYQEGPGYRGDELNEAASDDHYGRFRRYEDYSRSRSRSDDDDHVAHQVTDQEDKWDVPVARRMPRWRNRSLSPAALAQWSSLHHLHFSLDMLPDLPAAKEFQRSLLTASPHLSELHLVSSDGYKQGLGMVGVAGFRWVQEVNLCACELLDTGCFRYFAALPGVTSLVISDPMSRYFPQNPEDGRTERQRVIKELRKGRDGRGKTRGGQAYKGWKKKWAAGSDTSDRCTREAAELTSDCRSWDYRSWDSRWEAESDHQVGYGCFHRGSSGGTREEEGPSSSHGSGGLGEDAARAPSPADRSIGGEVGAVESYGGEGSRMSGGRAENGSGREVEEGSSGREGAGGEVSSGTARDVEKAHRKTACMGGGDSEASGQGERSSPGQRAGVRMELED